MKSSFLLSTSFVLGAFGAMMTALPAWAGIESIHRTSMRTPEGVCQGEHRAYMPSRLTTVEKGLELTGIGYIEVEFFGQGADINTGGITVSGDAVFITSRAGKSGPDNFSKNCGPIGSVKLGLRVNPVTSDKTVFLDVGGSRIPIKVHARKVTALRWTGASPANYTGQIANSGCVTNMANGRLGAQGVSTNAGFIRRDPADPNTLRVTLSPDDLAAFNECAAAPRDFWVGFEWDREAGEGEILYTNATRDPISASFTRISSAGNALLHPKLNPVVGEETRTRLSFDMTDLNTYVGTSVYEVRVSPTSGASVAPLRLILDTFPMNGVRELTFGVPASTSEVRKLKLNYTLHAPAQPGMKLKWSTYAYQTNAAGAKTGILNTCFKQPEGLASTVAGARTGTVELELTDAPGCGDRTAGVTLRLDYVQTPDFNYSPYIGTEHTVDLPKYASMKLANPPVNARPTPSLMPGVARPVLKQDN